MIAQKKIWLYDPGMARPVEVEAIQIDGEEGPEWHYIRRGFVSPLYDKMYETKLECLEAELKKEERWIASVTDRIKRIQGQIEKAKAE